MTLNFDLSTVHEILKNHDYKQVDIISILQAIKASGALHADLELI